LGKNKNMFLGFYFPTTLAYLWATSLRHEYRIFFSKHLSFRFSRNLTSEAILRESFEHREGSFISWHIITRFKTLNKFLKTREKCFKRKSNFWRNTLMSWLFCCNKKSEVGTVFGASCPPNSNNTACTYISCK